MTSGLLQSAIVRTGQQPDHLEELSAGRGVSTDSVTDTKSMPSALDSSRPAIRFSQSEQTSLMQMVTELATYLRGWLGYFDDCQTPSVLQTIESWLRRRLRSVVWKQWKRGRTRFRELRKRGVGKDLAAPTAGSPHGRWRIANRPLSPLLCRMPTLSSSGFHHGRAV